MLLCGCAHLVLTSSKCVLNVCEDPITQTTFEGGLGCIWPLCICSLFAVGSKHKKSHMWGRIAMPSVNTVRVVHLWSEHAGQRLKQVCQASKCLWGHSCSCEETAHSPQLEHLAFTHVSARVVQRSHKIAQLNQCFFFFYISSILHYSLKANKSFVSNIQLQ